MPVKLSIKETFKKYNLSVNEVAEKMNISRQTLSTHINGNPSIEILARIADIIGCSISELITEEQTDNNILKITCPHCGKAVNIKIDKP